MTQKPTGNTSLNWAHEYSQQGIPSSNRLDPSGSLLQFFDFAPDLMQAALSGTLAGLDIGCGTGRNTVVMASKGFDMTSLDFVAPMIDRTNELAGRLGLSGKVKAVHHDIAKPWPVENLKFDVAIDTFCFKHQIPVEAKNNYHKELRRSLKPNAYFLLTLAGIDDGYYGQFLASSPEPERNVIVDPENSIPSILYSKDDILSEFGDAFTLQHHKHKEFIGDMHGRPYERSTHLFIFVRN